MKRCDGLLDVVFGPALMRGTKSAGPDEIRVLGFSHLTGFVDLDSLSDLPGLSPVDLIIAPWCPHRSRAVTGGVVLGAQALCSRGRRMVMIAAGHHG